MELMEDIQALFANSDIGAAYEISSLPLNYPAWVVRYMDGFGVALPYQGKEVYEEFANVALYDDDLQLSGKTLHCLFLISSMEESRNEFAAFCKDFAYPGIQGRQRRELLENPVAWWERWKVLIGNAITEKKPYTVLGELLMYEHLLRTGKNVRWEGPKAASHDLICFDEEYEVKSTLSRYDKVIHITGQFQLQKAAKRLYLYFCRFEKNQNGISINDMVEKLVGLHGESRESINGKLSGLGYSLGNSSRREKYQIHEVIQYSIDESFPRITPEMFKDEALPTGIKQLSYDVDLSVVSGSSVRLIETRSN